MKTVIQFFIVGILFCLVSCQKEFSVENGTGGGTTPTPPPTGINDSIYLDRAIEVYDDMAGSIDSTVRHFQYDNLKRVTTITDTAFSNGTVANYYLTTYFYTGNDTLPYKNINTNLEIAAQQHDTIVDFFTYDAQGRVIIDSSIYHFANSAQYVVYKDVYNKIYAPGQIYYDRVITGLIVPPTASVDGHYRDTAWLDANLNIKKDVSYTCFDITPPTQYINYSGLYTYDNHPNPYSRLNIFASILNVHENRVYAIPQINNYLTLNSQEYTSGPPNLYTQSFTLAYNSKGLLIQSLGVFGTGDVTRNYYRYKSL